MHVCGTMQLASKTLFTPGHIVNAHQTCSKLHPSTHLYDMCMNVKVIAHQTWLTKQPCAITCVRMLIKKTWNACCQFVTWSFFTQLVHAQRHSGDQQWCVLKTGNKVLQMCANANTYDICLFYSLVWLSLMEIQAHSIPWAFIEARMLHVLDRSWCD